jgi:hypothetical protein
VLVPASAAAGGAAGGGSSAGDASQAVAAVEPVQGGWMYEIAFFGSQPLVKLVKNKTEPKFDPPIALDQLDLIGDTNCFENAVRESGAVLKPSSVRFNHTGTKTELSNLFRDGCKVYIGCQSRWFVLTANGTSCFSFIALVFECINLCLARLFMRPDPSLLWSW